MAEIIDVTLRDGGHAVDFNWPIKFARSYYQTLSNLPQVKTLELGYWGQTAKSRNMFYDLNFDKVCDVTQRQRRKNVSVMIDYHYCSHNMKDYPTDRQSEISMIRVCSRKEDMDQAIEFSKELKLFTNINVSFNVLNASNYSPEELLELSRAIKTWPFDYIYFADTHGDIDLSKDFEKFKPVFKACKEANKKTGFHLHDHSGMAMVNYKEIIKHNLDSTDTSVRGMGKGAGNLKLEHVLDKKYLATLADFILKNKKLLSMEDSIYELITSKYAVTDNYAKEASQKCMDIFSFDKACSRIKGLHKDSYLKDSIK